MHSETFATFPNGNWKRSIPLKNHLKTFRKRLQTLISAPLFSALGYIPRVLSQVEFGRVLVQLTRITRALFQNIKILRKFPYFYSLFPFRGCSLLCWAIYGPVRLSLYTQNMSICWWSFLSLSLAVKFLTFWDQYSTAQKYLVVAKFRRYFHEIKARWNTEISSHLTIRLWLANNKTPSNQRGANGVTSAS